MFFITPTCITCLFSEFRTKEPVSFHNANVMKLKQVTSFRQVEIDNVQVKKIENKINDQ